MTRAQTRKRLLLATTSTMRGGAEEYGLAIARGAVEDGYEVLSAFADTAETKSLQADCRAAGIRHVPFDIAGADQRWDQRGNRASLLKGVLRAVQMLRHAKPDVALFYLQTARRGLPLILAAALLKVPAIVVFQLVDPATRFSARERAIYRWARERGQQYIAISHNNAGIIAERLDVPLEKIRVIYNGAAPGAAAAKDDLRKTVRGELGLTDAHTMVLTVARLHPQKGHRDIIPALPYLQKEYPELRMVWAGDGPLRDELTAKLDEYGVRDCVMMLGHRSDVTRLLAAADLFLLPTYYEGGQSIAMAEAMALGVPVVASRASGIPEVIEDRVHGLLFRVGDPCDLMETMRWALAHRETWPSMAEAASARNTEFSGEKMIAQTLEVIRETTREKGIGSA